MRARYKYEASVLTKGSLEDVFSFFSSASNLELLTPKWLRFEILSPEPIAMREGTRIDYRLRIKGVPLTWKSVISVWEPPYRFVDEQLHGPYREWRHEHRFEKTGDGTRIIDSIRYDHLGGSLVNRLFVRPDLERIFSYRQEKMGELFGITEDPGAL